MSIARIQFLNKTDLGWHIRFTAQDDSFWTLVDHFKDEQRKSAKINCHWNPQLFDKKGGWFITERILLKYADYFENYSSMRSQAETRWDMDHQEDLWGETKSERDEQEEARRKEKIKRDRERVEEDKERLRRKREEAWKQFEREQREEYTRRPARPTSTGLTLSVALDMLGFSPFAYPTEIEVKKAFRQLAMKVHPDHGGSHDAMVMLNKAYQLVLWSVQGVKV